MIVVCRMKNYIQPFERHLALKELQALASGDPVPLDGTMGSALSFQVRSSARLEHLKNHLAYWETVGTREQHVTMQVRGEISSLIARNGASLESLPGLEKAWAGLDVPNRRCLRYGPHGVHEYRGKFFPQLVPALMNIARVPSDGIVVDPMCGSGTTLVEAVIAGRSAFGIDMNPLSVFATDVKCRALKLNSQMLIDSFEHLSRRLQRPTGALRLDGYFATLDSADQDYLSKWFPAASLKEIDRIKATLMAIRDTTIRDFYALCLSNILRGVSWQKVDDLRVRKESKELPKGEATARFLAEALRSTKSLVAFNALRGRRRLGAYEVLEADARSTSHVLPRIAGAAHAVITSPPYATALPYLDTDRLSLIYLGLLPRREHRSRDVAMIGNREVSNRQRSQYWSCYENNRRLLPRKTRSLIEQIESLNQSRRVQTGFRRRNLSALLAKYFLDMRDVMMEQKKLLRSAGHLFMIAGNNRTTAGGVEIEIKTTSHLAAIAESVGFTLAGSTAMEMLVSRDIFRKNAMPSERILTLVKP